MVEILRAFSPDAFALVAYAPVVVIGPASHQGDLAPLVTAGVADFVVRAAGSLPGALGLGEQRLRQAPDLLKIALPPVPLDNNRAEALGEVFRHELTTVLSNGAVLLLGLLKPAP